jgi:hypothetical protein
VRTWLPRFLRELVRSAAIGQRSISPLRPNASRTLVEPTASKPMSPGEPIRISKEVAAHGPLEFARFLVWDKPRCVWTRNVAEKNREFLAGIDPDFWIYQSELNLPNLAIDTKLYASIGIRLAYSHALETFFAFLGAALQAPDCVFGWLLCYDDDDLRKLVMAIRDGVPFRNRASIERPSWPSVCDALLTPAPDQEPARELRSRLAPAWSSLASDFLDDYFRFEHNSIKHGLRFRSGGFFFKSTGVEDQSDEGVTIGGSEFGSTFFIKAKLGADKINFGVLSASHNWEPERLRDRIILAALSVKNLVAALRLRAGCSTDVFVGPTDEGIWQSAWDGTPGVRAFRFNENIELAHIAPFSADDIKASYAPLTYPSKPCQ